MAIGEFHHFGVPTNTKQDNETYLEGGKVSITDPGASPYNIEFLRFEADSPMPKALQDNCHAAFIVKDLAAALEGQNVILEPFNATETLKVAFITDGDAVIELMQNI